MGFDYELFLQLIVFGLVEGGLYAVVASGFSLVYGVMQILNIAHGEFLMLSAYATFWLYTLFNVSPLLSLLITIPFMFCFGLIIFRIVVLPLEKAGSRNLVEKSTLIAFFGLLILLQNTALVLFSADYRSITYLLNPVRFFFISISLNRLVVLGVSFFTILVLHFFLTRTYPGRAIRAITLDREAGMLMGINAERLSLVCFGLSTALAGIGGSLAGMLVVVTPHMGYPFLIKSFVVMIIGGLGNIIGCLYAGWFLGIVEFLGAYIVGEAYRSAIDYVILVVFLVLVSRGYLQTRRRSL